MSKWRGLPTGQHASISFIQQVQKWVCCTVEWTVAHGTEINYSSQNRQTSEYCQ